MNGLRDVRADAAYFDGVLDLMRRHNERHDQRLDDSNAVWRKPSYRGAAAGDAMVPRWARFSALYSAGASVAELRAEYESVLVAAERAGRLAKETMPPDTIAVRFGFGANRDFYRQWLSLVALGIVFDVDEATFGRVVAAVGFSGGDRLIDRLIAVRVPEHPIGMQLAFPSVTAGLERVFDSRDPGDVGTYLAGWYPAWKGVDGWGGHAALDKNQYYGYRAFEVAGVVAALGIDDSSFRENEYYPGDLALGIDDSSFRENEYYPRDLQTLERCRVIPLNWGSYVLAGGVIYEPGGYSPEHKDGMLLFAVDPAAVPARREIPLKEYRATQVSPSATYRGQRVHDLSVRDDGTVLFTLRTDRAETAGSEWPDGVVVQRMTGQHPGDNFVTGVVPASELSDIDDDIPDEWRPFLPPRDVRER
ncbi:PoNe immunity protein domain-containing protein [Microbacterium sp. ZW T5_45]|uniref:PoNe immunity protein domain-containing protein n=1 Tax=Microbacterium sp. ZW T5_45 TaxID=3378080 RepID=UPI0038548073